MPAGAPTAPPGASASRVRALLPLPLQDPRWPTACIPTDSTCPAHRVNAAYDCTLERLLAAVNHPLERSPAAAAAAQQPELEGEGQEAGEAAQEAERRGGAAGAAAAAAGTSQESLVTLLRERLRVPPRGGSVQLRALLKTGLLDGLALTCRTSRGSKHGSLCPGGHIACSDECCQGTLFNPSDWEKHAGSKHHRPAHCIFLEGTSSCAHSCASPVHPLALLQLPDQLPCSTLHLLQRTGAVWRRCSVL